MADINFSCPSCNQLLTADDGLIGQEIACPSCNETIIVQDQSGMGGAGGLRLSVPAGGGDPNLIQKPAKPLDAAAKAAIKVRCKTFRHHDHVKDGKDSFDDAVSRFLAEVGEENVVSVESIQYTRLDGEAKIPMTDYGALVIYKRL
jgi:hypothetical protein